MKGLFKIKKNVLFIMMILISCSPGESNKNNTAIRISDSIQESITEKGNISYFENSNALKLLDFSNDSTLFNSFVNNIDKMNPPFSFNSMYFQNDSIDFNHSNTAENFTNRTISTISEFENELTPLFKFFRNISINNESIFDEFCDSTISIINIINVSTLGEERTFYLIYLIAHITLEKPATYLCTFSRSGKFIDCLYIRAYEDGFNGAYCRSSIVIYDKVNINCCDYLYTGRTEGETIEDCEYISYKISNNGHFILIKRINKKKLDP